MRTFCYVLVLLAGLATALSVGVAVCGCGGNETTGGGGGGGGAITGNTRDAATGAPLGGVRIAVQAPDGREYWAVSRAPGGDFTITNVPAGTYTVLRITPDPSVGPEQLVAVTIIVRDGETTATGTVLVLDELPPSPPS